MFSVSYFNFLKFPLTLPPPTMICRLLRCVLFSLKGLGDFLGIFSLILVWISCGQRRDLCYANDFKCDEVYCMSTAMGFCRGCSQGSWVGKKSPSCGCWVSLRCRWSLACPASVLMHLSASFVKDDSTSPGQMRPLCLLSLHRTFTASCGFLQYFSPFKFQNVNYEVPLHVFFLIFFPI